MVQAMVWLKLHLAWNSHYKLSFTFVSEFIACIDGGFFLFVFSFVVHKVRDKPHESWTEVEPENNGGWGRRGARREGIIFFCLTLRGCINMIYKWKFHPKNCQLHRLKNSLSQYGKKIYTTCFRDLKIRKIFSNLFSIYWNFQVQHV